MLCYIICLPFSHAVPLSNVCLSLMAKRVKSGCDAGDVLRFVKLSPFASSPVKGSDGAAGFDLFAAESKSIPSGGRSCVKTDLQISVPKGSYGRIAPRSGLAAKVCVDVGAGVIDADYRGNVLVLLLNFGAEKFEVHRGDRIAQLILEKIHSASATEVLSLDSTDRGVGGFGSTGLV